MKETDAAAAAAVTEFHALVDRRLPKCDLCSLPDIAGAFRCSRSLVYQWIRSGELRAANLGSGTKACWRVQRADVLAFARKRGSEGERP
jgi:excisionase family DNA binding protein